MLKTGRAPLLTIGHAEQVAFPELGVPFVRAKVDTGARTSALHATRLHHFDHEGAQWVRFSIPARVGRPAHRVEAPLVGVKQIRSSNGSVQKRFVIKTRFLLGKKSFIAEISLSNRSQMGYAMLLGRTALRRRFIVDVSQSYLLGGGPAPKDRRS